MEENHETRPAPVYSAYGISRRNPLTWLAVLFAVLSFAARIVHISVPDTGAERIGSALYAVIAMILSGLACLWFALELIVHGKERLFKTAKPEGLFCVFLIVRACVFFAAGAFAPKNGWLLAADIVLLLALMIVYRMTVSTGGRSKVKPVPRRIAALVLFVIALGLHLAVNRALFTAPSLITALEEGSVLLAILAVLCVLIGVKKRESDRPLPQCGDRNDGRRIRSLDPMNGVAVYIMPERVPSSNLFRDCFECSNADAYIREKREEGLAHFGITHLMLAAYARTVSQRPAVNRFISGQKTYSRDDSIEVSMTIKKDMTLDGSETIITVYLDPNDTAYTVYEKFNKEVEKVKSTQELDSSFDKLAGLLNLIPGVFMKFTVWLLKTLDYFGHLPRFLTKLSPFHGSMFVTSMGSLGIPPVFHHLYNFGNIPVFLAFGMKRMENEVQPDGSVKKKRYIDFTVNTDERICDGFYFASAFKYFKRCMADPHRLDTPPEEVIHDVE